MSKAGKTLQNILKVGGWRRVAFDELQVCRGRKDLFMMAGKAATLRENSPPTVGGGINTARRTTMSAPQYLIRIYWSDDDEAFVAEVPSLPGCVSHGDTLAEAAANAQEAIELWLESAGRHGDGIPEPGFRA